ncbi:MAG TPA: S-layer homology domain-containing protein [Bryobacteraceae bacterium]|nr:S-layer homology domain-containing protein [Bryobacteraceae bacterium]
MLHFFVLVLSCVSLYAQSRRPVIGETLPVAVQGIWNNGVWRAEVRSPGAAALKLHFTGFHVADGRVDVASAGTFRADGPLNDGDFWTPTVSGDSVVIEYRPGIGTAEDIPFEIREAAHFYPLGGGKQRDRALVPGCHVDLAAQPAWQTAAASLALMVFQSTDQGVLYWTICNGTLLADKNRTNRPLLLTANHCIRTEEEARTLETFWNFQTTAQASLPYDSGFLFGDSGQWNPSTLPNTLQKVTGARLLASVSRAEGDASLLELSGPPPPGARFAVLNGQELPMGAATGTVHHPDGSWKRIATGFRVTAVSGVDVDVNIASTFRASDYFYKSLETLGLTDYGSSGSGLLTADFLVSGTLSYGPEPSCTDPGRNGVYGRSTHFFPRFQSILNNAAPGACTAEITAANQWIGSGQAEGTFHITAPSGCRWAVASDFKHIRVNTTSGSGNATVVYQVSANTDAFSRVGTLSVITEQHRIVHIMQRGAVPVQIYTDVPGNHPFAEEINFLHRRNVRAYGCAPVGAFCPDGTTTRGQMAEFIIRALFNGDNFTASPNPYFSDVFSLHPAFNYVQKMREMRLTDGCTATAFCPDEPVSRGQMAAFIVRAVQYRDLLDTRAGFSYAPVPYFTDTTVNTSIFFDYIQKMKELGITSGCTISTYCGDAPNARGQIAVFLTRGLFGLLQDRSK